jgi:2-polyprenyl-6-methoxyphenol hydroxylase-like FAD-dependent oxidoreductase
VEIFEASHELDKQPRAAIYGSAAVPELRRAGIIDEIRRRGMSPTQVAWRRWGDHAELTHMDGSPMADVGGEDLRMACLVLDQLDQLMLDEFLAKYDGAIHWKHKVTGTGQDETKAWIEVETPEGNKTFYGDYIVGCDGATSKVRKSLFGEEFPGFTWERQIVATNVSRDLGSQSHFDPAKKDHCDRKGGDAIKTIRRKGNNR